MGAKRTDKQGADCGCAGANVIDIKGLPGSPGHGRSGPRADARPDHALTLTRRCASRGGAGTLKMRLGWDTGRTRRNLPSRASRRCSPATVHAAPAASSQVDSGARSQGGDPGQVNGDIARKMRRPRSLPGADAVMAGRAAQGRPGPGQSRAPSPRTPQGALARDPFAIITEPMKNCSPTTACASVCAMRAHLGC
jgi:tRNA-dihydrouridine synthase